MAIAALVCGILGIVGGWFPFVQYFTLILSIVAIVLGNKSRAQLTEAGEPTGMATAGFVLGIIGVVLNVAGILCVLCVGGALLSTGF